MCNRARMSAEPETIATRFGATWLADRPRDNRFHPRELVPMNRAYVVRREGAATHLDVMDWDVLGGQAKWPMTNVRQLKLPQWRRLAQNPANRCLVPLTAFCEWTALPDPRHGIKGEVWFSLPTQPIFAVAGLWQTVGDRRRFAMVTCDANELVASVHPKAMLTVLRPEDEQAWLTGNYDMALSLQRPFSSAQMVASEPVFPTRPSVSQTRLL